MPHSFWYGFLLVISISIFLFTLFRIRDKKLIGLYTFLSGLTYTFEYVVMVLLNSYAYHPNLLNNDYFDSLLGAVVSDAFVVPMTGVFIAGLKLHWLWIFVIISMILTIEEGFLYLGIYTQFWWKTGYTALGLLLFFTTAKKWYPQLHQDLGSKVRFFTLLFTSILMQASVTFIIVAFFGGYYYEIGWFENHTRDHISFIMVVISFIAIIFTSLVTFDILWKWRFLALILIWFVDWLLWQFGILHLSPKWSLAYFFIIRCFILIFLDKFNGFFLKTKGDA